ncbi:MAG: L-threonylcarbamoyladenylate synthase [Acidiferrobacter sp.]
MVPSIKQEGALTIRDAVRILRAGGLVVFPTETVYGLGADAANAGAVRAVFAAKARPADHPVIVHIASAAQLTDWAIDIPASAWRLAEQFWPGPLTMVLRRHPQVASVVTGGQDTVAVRVPYHATAQALLAAFGGGLVGPSANRFGRVSPTTAAHVRDEFGDRLPILEGGPCAIGIESTIIALSGGEPHLLRPGVLTVSQLEDVLQTPLKPAPGGGPRAPGGLPVHYAPQTPVRMVASSALIGEAQRYLAQGERVAVLAMSGTRRPAACISYTMPTDSGGWARELYAALRRLDDAHCARILVETPPATPEWQGVVDRLTRAAAVGGDAA